MEKLEELNRAITDSGIKLSMLAKRLEISRATLWKKLRGEIKITLAEANIIAAVIGLTDEEKQHIFLP